MEETATVQTDGKNAGDKARDDGRDPALSGASVLPPEAVADEPEVLGGRNGPLRRCIVSGTVGKKDRMLRFVVGPGEEIVPDLEETLPGRGLWLTAEGDLVEKAVAKNAFSRAARRKVSVPPDLAGRLPMLMRRRVLDLIGLAARGGAAVAGFEKVRDALRAGRVGNRGVPGLWLEAADGAADGRRKLAPLAEVRALLPVDLFDRGELGRALGRDEAVHVLLADGPLAGRLRREIGRLATILGRPLQGSDGV
ncbi:MAG: hypothetical protein RLY86_1178 [Pseudomonadota bacterium]|jgi:predicted RNA-binding protein YlxR (DUF448 family)